MDADGVQLIHYGIIKMKCSVLASGSKGNCTYIETNNHKILVDIGTSSLYTEKKLQDLEIAAKDIDSVFITHDHVDHINGLKVFCKKYHPNVYMTEKLYEKLSDMVDNYTIIDDKLELDNLLIQTFKTSHDATDSKGYIFTENDSSIVYVTDTGYINYKWHGMLTNKNLYIFESNHDTDLLMNCSYPFHIKQRILGDKGHLSNKDSALYLSKFIGNDTKYVILAHLSEQNNNEELALSEYKKKNKGDSVKVYVAKQNESTELIEV